MVGKEPCREVLHTVEEGSRVRRDSLVGPVVLLLYQDLVGTPGIDMKTTRRLVVLV